MSEFLFRFFFNFNLKKEGFVIAKQITTSKKQQQKKKKAAPIVLPLLLPLLKRCQHYSGNS